MEPITHHLAQVNIGRMRAPLDSPVMADFVAQLDAINALAETRFARADRIPGSALAANVPSERTFMASPVSSERIHRRRGVLPGPAAKNASVRPSGDTLKASLREIPSGGAISNRNARTGAGLGLR